MEYRPIIVGLGTLLVEPNSRLRRWLLPVKPQGGTRSPDYCYGVWLKHMCLLWEQGLKDTSGDVAEFGPGESLGSGIAALLSGARSYTALDVAPFAPIDRNLILMDGLAKMFLDRAPRPARGWPAYDHLLDEKMFPSNILTDAQRGRSLAHERLEHIRAAIRDLRVAEGRGPVRYYAPWRSASMVAPESFDLIFSQSVLQYVDDLDDYYRTCWSWLRPGGWMSHQIDLSSMGMTRQWNGHWSYPPAIWRLVRGRRPFFMTGRTGSEHLAALERAGFSIVSVLSYAMPGIARGELCRTRAGISAEDLNCSCLFVIARKL